MEREKTVDPISEKQCETCRKILPVFHFHKRKENKDGYSAQCRQCKTDTRPYQRQHYLKNKEQKLDYSKHYQVENHEAVKAQKRQYWAHLRLEVLKKITFSHGSSVVCCLACRFADIRVLQIDHINGGGTPELRHFRQHDYYRHILDLSLDQIRVTYQILCANCNMIKKEEHRENYIWKEKGILK